MKKRLIALILVLLTALVLYVIKGFIPDIFLNLGKNAYMEKDYAKASGLLKVAVHLNSKNQDARYYYVQSLIKLPPTLEVQRELFAVSQKNIPDSADLIADRQIEAWKQQIFANSGENYIEQVPFNDKILRWDIQKFPLTVSFKNESPTALPDYYIASIKNAFLQWQRTSGNLIQFQFVDSDKANILIKIVSSSEMNKCEQQDCKYVVAYTTPAINGDMLKNMSITFYDLNNLSKPFSQREIYNTALHEIGHALGIMGHSYNKDDLMYMETSRDSGFEGYRSDFQLISNVDLNTLELLYRLVPDITNTELSKYDNRHQFYAPIVMGSEELVNSRKLLEAQNYIKSAPNLPNGYIDLASAYAEQKEYNKAIAALNQALGLSSNDSERFLAYYNLAVVYMNIKDWDESLKNANLANGIQPSADIDGLIGMIAYNRGDKQLAKKIYIDTVSKSPDNMLNSMNLVTIYLQEFNFVEAGRTLNKLVVANPDARNNPKVKALSLLMILFK